MIQHELEPKSLTMKTTKTKTLTRRIFSPAWVPSIRLLNHSAHEGSGSLAMVASKNGLVCSAQQMNVQLF